MCEFRYITYYSEVNRSLFLLTSCPQESTAVLLYTPIANGERI
jgi:hypothetical protein